MQAEEEEDTTVEKTLDRLRIGQQGVVTHIGGEGVLHRRMADMGITPGARVMMRRAAPWGDPIQINIRGYELTLRKAEAKNIRVAVEATGPRKRR